MNEATYKLFCDTASLASCGRDWVNATGTFLTFAVAIYAARYAVKQVKEARRQADFAYVPVLIAQLTRLRHVLATVAFLRAYAEAFPQKFDRLRKQYAIWFSDTNVRDALKAHLAQMKSLAEESKAQLIAEFDPRIQESFSKVVMSGQTADEAGDKLLSQLRLVEGDPGYANKLWFTQDLEKRAKELEAALSDLIGTGMESAIIIEQVIKVYADELQRIEGTQINFEAMTSPALKPKLNPEDWNVHY